MLIFLLKLQIDLADLCRKENSSASQPKKPKTEASQTQIELQMSLNTKGQLESSLIQTPHWQMIGRGANPARYTANLGNTSLRIPDDPIEKLHGRERSSRPFKESHLTPTVARRVTNLF